MKKKYSLLLIFLFIIYSCIDLIPTKKLNLKVVENKDIKVELYDVSEISNGYTQIYLTNKRWNKSELILRANSEIIDSVYIKLDSIIIISKYENPMSLIYDFTTKKYGYNIAIKKEKIPAEKIALDFINQYVKYCNYKKTKPTLIEWISGKQNVSENFKSELKIIIAEAKKIDPELGLGFDPIFNAQDYPDNGFELVKSDKSSEIITVKGKKWNDFKLNIKMVRKNKQWLVNGIGIINMTEI